MSSVCACIPRLRTASTRPPLTYIHPSGPERTLGEPTLRVPSIHSLSHPSFCFQRWASYLGGYLPTLLRPNVPTANFYFVCIWALRQNRELRESARRHRARFQSDAGKSGRVRAGVAAGIEFVAKRKLRAGGRVGNRRRARRNLDGRLRGADHSTSSQRVRVV